MLPQTPLDRFGEPRKRVAVLGCGPSGLVAAYAALLAGADVRILSDRLRPSGLFGAQYLHEPIPYLGGPSEPLRIKYQLLGSAESYRLRVYGSHYDGTVSPEDLEEEHDAWDLRSTYAALWKGLQSYMSIFPIRATDIPALKDANDLVVSTIPAESICPGWNFEKAARSKESSGPHTFRSMEVWAAGEAPELGIRIDGYDQSGPGTVVLNGMEDGPAWYRISNIFGRKTVEWPGRMSWVPVKSAVRVKKPISTNCDCWEGSDFLRVGRYGAWKKGVLVHDTFNAVYERLTKEEG